MKILIIFFGVFLDNILAFGVFDKEIGSVCSSEFTGKNGICVEGKNCAEFKTSRYQLEICSFDGVVPIVCCPQRNKNFRVLSRRISAKKCEEFASQRPRQSHDKVQWINGRPIVIAASDKTLVKNFPHMSAIGWRLYEGISWRCGGSLISEKFVLSAAHCTNSVDGQPNVIKVGNRNFDDPYDLTDPQELDIKNIFVHPKYRANLKYHDIALFEMEGKIIFNAFIHPACLHQTDDNLSNYIFTAMGWGQSNLGSRTSATLLRKELFHINKVDCNKKYSFEQEIPEGITNSQFCAWDPKGNKENCLGFSGGPLVIKKIVHQIEVYEIVGITSFGKFCSTGAPTVYVKVSSYLDWIERVVWPNKLYFST